MAEALRMLIVDDQRRTRQSLRALLATRFPLIRMLEAESHHYALLVKWDGSARVRSPVSDQPVPLRPRAHRDRVSIIALVLLYACFFSLFVYAFCLWHKIDESTCLSFGSGLGGLVSVRQATKPSGRISTTPSADTPIFACQPFSRSSRSASAPMR
jgi:hypothetical protein